MQKLENVTIVILRDPDPEAQEPKVIKDSYPGLILKPAHFMAPGETRHYPNGVYLVPITVFRNALKAQRPEAYELCASQWGRLSDVAQETGAVMALAFSADCCERREAVH